MSDTSAIRKKMTDKGFTCLGDSGTGASYFFQGRYIKDFWMWTRKLTEYTDGSVSIRTVKVTDLREAALHYWRDKWVPIKPITHEVLRAMEAELRMHVGLQKEGVQFPNGEFLEYAFVPEDYLAPQDLTGKKRVGEIDSDIIDSFRKQKQSEGRM